MKSLNQIIISLIYIKSRVRWIVKIMFEKQCLKLSLCFCVWCESFANIIKSLIYICVKMGFFAQGCVGKNAEFAVTKKCIKSCMQILKEECRCNDVQIQSRRPREE